MRAAYHAQAHALVRVHQVRQDLGRRCDGDAALVPQFVESALHAQVREPVLTVLHHNATESALVHRSVCPSSPMSSRHIALSSWLLPYRRTARHRSQQAVVNLDDLLDRLTCDPVSRRRPRVRRHDDAALEAEGQRRRPVRNLDRAVWV